MLYVSLSEVCMKKTVLRLGVVTLISLSLGVAAFSQGKSGKGDELKAAREYVDKASRVMTEIMRAEDKAIPRELLQKAHAIAVFPGAIKAGFIIAGQGGAGVVVRKLNEGWSAPAFLNMGGASFGPQIGAQRTDYVLVIMNPEGLNELLKDKFEMGAEGSVAAGPVGRTAAASTNARLDAGILTYSRSKGLFAGLALKGIVIEPNDDVQNAVYGGKRPRQMLIEAPIRNNAAPAGLQKFANTVATYAR
jgi:SH3 domain-containing YSC84-like protein 1